MVKSLNERRNLAALTSNPKTWGKRLQHISKEWDLWCQQGWPGAVGDQAPSFIKLATKSLGKVDRSPPICIYVVVFVGKSGSVPKKVQEGCYVGQTRKYLSSRTNDRVEKASASRFGTPSFSGDPSSVTVINHLKKV